MRREEMCCGLRVKEPNCKIANMVSISGWGNCWCNLHACEHKTCIPSIMVNNYGFMVLFPATNQTKICEVINQVCNVDIQHKLNNQFLFQDDLKKGIIAILPLHLNSSSVCNCFAEEIFCKDLIDVNWWISWCIIKLDKLVVTRYEVSNHWGWRIFQWCHRNW